MAACQTSEPLMVIPLYLLGALQHGIHGGAGREWLLPVILVAGFGAAWVGKWVAGRSRRDGSDHDEPI